MENYVGIKLKRKDVEDVNDDFSDFSLSSPARKMRRLNAELPPIIEEDEPDMLMGYEQSMPRHSFCNGFVDQVNSPVIEELPCVPENEEKAIVLFKPIDSGIPYSQGKFSVDPNLISCFKNQAFWGDQLNSSIPRQDNEPMENENNQNACRAVVPWVQSPTLNPVVESHGYQTQVSEAMEAEVMGESTMEIEDSDATNAVDNDFSRLNEGLQHQWVQQHCMIPQPPEYTTTPIVWYR